MGNEAAIMKTLAGEKMPLLGVSARGILSGELFELEVEQRYRNDGDKNIEAIYTFPLASRAVLLGIEFELDGKKLVGTAVERKAAEQEYEQAIDEGNTAILLEKSSEGLYTINLGNLMAGEEAVVRYRYAEPLVREQGQLRLVIPTAIAPRYGNSESAGLKPHQIPGVDLGVSYPLALSIDVLGDLAKATLYSPSHPLSSAAIEHGIRIKLNKGWLDRDFILTLEDAGSSNVSIVKDGDQRVAMATFCPTMSDVDIRCPLSLRLAIDCSGSMAGDSITQARQAAIKVIETLRSEDEFDITCFGSQHRHVFGELRSADGRHISQATRALVGLDADMGGTEMEDALRSTSKLSSERTGGDVLLITDGEIWKIGSLIAMAQKSHLRYFIVGVGSSPSHVTLRQLAKETGGAYEAVSPNEDIELAVLRQFTRMRQPRATNLAVAWPVTPLWSTSLPISLFQGDTLHVYAAFDQDFAGAIKLTYTTDQGNQLEEEATVTAWKGNPESLTRIAIAERIQEMGSPGYGRVLGTARPVRMIKEQLAKLAVKYNLTTDYTHYLIVHERAEGEEAESLPEIKQVKQMLAAGWGGSGSVRCQPMGFGPPAACQMPASCGFDDMDDDVLFAPSEEIPSVLTSRRGRTLVTDQGDMDALDMPAFLRKPADGEIHSKYPHAELLNLLKWLLALVNDTLIHPDEFAGLVSKLNSASELSPLKDIIEAIDKQDLKAGDVWVALISWAAQQLGSECQLTRHALRSIQSLSGAIAPDRLAGLMVQFNELEAVTNSEQSSVTEPVIAPRGRGK